MPIGLDGAVLPNPMEPIRSIEVDCVGERFPMLAISFGWLQRSNVLLRCEIRMLPYGLEAPQRTCARPREHVPRPVSNAPRSHSGRYLPTRRLAKFPTGCFGCPAESLHEGAARRTSMPADC